MGFSTLTEALIFHRTVTRRNVNSLIVAHKDESSNNLFNMSKLFYENLPAELQPMRKASNARELVFENPTKSQVEKQRNPGLRSKIKIATAGGQGVGRSDTLQNVHISELAFWPGDKKDTLNGILQSVPNSQSTMVVIESTANGFDHFKELWDQAVAGESDFESLFFPWFDMQEYRVKVPPGFELTEEEEKLKEAFSLDNEQLAWRRWCIKNNCSGDLDLFKQEYPSTPGEAFLTTGTPVFDNDKVILRLNQLRAQYRDSPPLVGNIESNYTPDGDPVKGTESFIPTPNGWLTIYEKPRGNAPYVIGVDVAEGGADWSVAQVLDNTTGKQVATFRAHCDTDILAKALFSLGFYYNRALIAVEVNFDLHPVKELQRLGYPRQYVREQVDTYTGKLEQKFGFRTTTASRPPIIGELVKIVREDTVLINDITTLQEMLSFARNASGKPEAQAGKHDDTIMALAIAHAVRGQQSMKEKLPEAEKSFIQRDKEKLARMRTRPWYKARLY
ncbi:MAG TPA: DNA packaging protein [Bacillota bacterium]|nr:DNA packaging protein [Bacillota bacterium]